MSVSNLTDRDSAAPAANIANTEDGGSSGNQSRNSWIAKSAHKTLQDYEVLSVIGNGAFGTCYKVRDKDTGEVYAWKGMDYDELSDEQKTSLVSEINVLRQFQHPNIVQYYHHLVNHEAKSIYIVMECCDGGDLAKLIARARAEQKRFEEKYIWRVLYQICKALQVCHNRISKGTVLHRDIKPANIFLDVKGNAKLGDFGLARMLRRHEHFAATFVGTPYYMSPEMVKGSRYDRKSDVWAVGCLVYELCALRTPFQGRQFEQLSANISNGKYSSIPEVYSSDLQALISFMLEVEHDQRPGIEIVTRHPLLVRNISDLGEEFPQLIAAEEGFYVPAEDTPADTHARCKLAYSPWRSELSSTMYSEQYSFNEDYGQRRLSISDVFTPDLRGELFYSAKRRIFAHGHKTDAAQLKRLQSDSALYESILREDYASILGEFQIFNTKAQTKLPSPQKANGEANQELNPYAVSQHVFDEALQVRLHAISAQEALLQQRSQELDAREQMLNEHEKRLQELQLSLNEREAAAKKLATHSETAALLCSTLQERARMPPPPIPPRKPWKHDDTYCTIEPNDTMLQPPTVAKLNLAALPAPKAFPTLRKVTFQSPQKFIKYDIDSVKSGKLPVASNQFQVSVTSKASSEDSAESHTSTHRRKSILSLFGLSRSNKETKTQQQQQQPVKPTVAAAAPAMAQRQPLVTRHEANISSERTAIWTKEHKRAAFDLLAAMNAAEQDQSGPVGRHKLRQSVRDRNALHKNRMRRSLIVGKPPTFAAQAGGQLLI